MTRRSAASGRGPDDRARLADALKDARATSGLSGARAGAAAGIGQSKISKLERAALLPSLDDVRTLCRVYGVPARRRDELLALASGLREEQSARLSMSRRVGEMQHRIGKLKRAATLIQGFQPTMVFGLLQTPAYAACVFGQQDSRRLSPSQAEQAVDERLAQQSILDDTSKEIRLVMTEGTLRWQAGSATIMAEQLEFIAAAIERWPHARIGVVPWYRPVEVFALHGFHIYDERTVVFGTETATAFLSGPADVATYSELFTALEAAAVYDDEARAQLIEVAGQFRDLAAR